MSLRPSAHVDTFARDNLPPEDQWPPLEFTLPELQFPDRLNAAVELLDRTIEEHGADRPAVLAPGGLRWTYGDLRARANQVARILVEDLGVVPGNRVMLRSPNNPWTVAAWLGVLKAGAVAVTTMHALRAGEIGDAIRLTRPTVALVDHRFADELRPVAEERGVAVVEFGGDSPDDLTRRCASKPEDFQAVDTSSDDVALLAPTSGSTGTPKVTMHFHRDILANAETFARHLLAPTPDDVFAGSAPFAFTFGLGALVVFPLRFGASTFLTERATPAEFAQHVHDSGATVISTAPTAYRAILREGKADLLSGVRAAVSAGEPLPKATWEDVHRETGLSIIDGIGATEMLHIFISAAGDDIRPGATGRAVPGYRATVLDDDGNETPRGTPGRLAVVGPTGCRYLGGDPRQQLYVAHGWNITGDTYVQDEDGYFHFHSRTDNLIVSSGYNISGPEVESAVGSHPDVVEVAVVGRPDDDRGNVVTAFVVLRDGVTGDDATRKEIQDHVKQTIAPYKYPRDVRFVDSVPRNPSGKLQHYRLRKQLQDEARRRDAQAASSAAPATTDPAPAAPATTDHAR